MQRCFGIVSGTLMIFVLCLMSCSSGDESGEAKTADPAASDQKGDDFAEGPDLNVPPELGGVGFNELAAELGFETSVPNEATAKFFGSPEAKTGGEWRFVIPRFVLTFRPLAYGINATFAENEFFNQMCYESLLNVNHATLEFLPQIASHWKISDDKRVYTFRINPAARFSHGKRVTAHDVVATWRLLVDDELQAPQTNIEFRRFEEPVALSKYMLEVRTNEAQWRSFLTFANSLSVLPADQFEHLTAGEFIEQFDFDMIAGSGEYIIKPEDIVKQQSYVFTRREDYWARDNPFYKYLGNFDKIKVEVVKDNPTLEYEKFKKDEQDFFYFTSSTMENWIHDNDYEAMQKGWVLKRRVQTNGPSGSWGISFNMRRPPFNDDRVRKAFAHLLNRERFISQVLYDEYKPLDSYFSNSPYENPDNPKIRFDPKRASELLAEAGWKERNRDGFLVKDGQPFVVNFVIPRSAEMFVTPYQQELIKAGIDFRLEFRDQNSIIKMVMEREFDLTWSVISGLVFPNPQGNLHSRLADKNENWNLEGVADPRIDALIDQYDTTFSQAKRVKLIAEIDALQMEICKKVLLYEPKGIKIATWNRFGVPDYVFERITSTSDFMLAILRHWWFDAEKDRQLREARSEGATIREYDGFEDARYWDAYRHVDVAGLAN